MFKIIMMLLTLLLTSCVNRALVCNQIKKSEIKPLVTCDLSFKFNRCRCRCFSLTKYAIIDDKYCGQSFISDDYPVDKCEGLQGFFVEDWATNVRPKQKKLYNLYENLCGEIKNGNNTN
jgi:hypothetical protein